MIKIMFVCHGNICRSPMAEVIFKDLIKKNNLEDEFFVASSATSSEEIWRGVGNPIYPPARDILLRKGYKNFYHEATLLTNSDLDKYDLFIGMDDYNIRNMRYILGNTNKIHKLLEYTGSNKNVADPWYSGDFEEAFDDIYNGSIALLNELTKK